ncbi:hypothetical protein F383_30142 [Gossypium arboreum]|uniref:Uncharacterized protein n=1 Tax=Gossypium arboreum TaxID=29729 RepID=A0A0B0PA47_GOSAR|nr:hypothetical protein F383_30142 [Gossypium arboreum]
MGQGEGKGDRIAEKKAVRQHPRFRSRQSDLGSLKSKSSTLSSLHFGINFCLNLRWHV